MLIDCYIGKTGQKSVRDRLEVWWIKISYVKPPQLGQTEAMFCNEVFNKLFGESLLSRKRLIVFLISICFIALCGVVIPTIFGAAGHTPEEVAEIMVASDASADIPDDDVYLFDLRCRLLQQFFICCFNIYYTKVD